ncbi:MAG: hypothetical protein IRY94_03085 [Rhodospirillaceae bacterium]|nr:hypothetical protein [Rhodospirillaceae bacterium]
MAISCKSAPAVLGIALATAMLGGCAQWDTSERLLDYAAWRQMDEPPAPRVEQVPVRHLVHFLPDAEALTAPDRVGLAAFLSANGIGRGAQVALSVVNPTGAGARGAARLQAVAGALNEMGVATAVQPPTVETPADIGGAQPDDIVVVAYKLAVLPPECPGYTTPVQLDKSGRPVQSWGCSNAANLGLMVADPADLVEGRTLAPADGEAAALGIERYRKGEVTPLQLEGTSPSSSGG